MSDELPWQHRFAWAALILVIVGLLGAGLWERLKDTSPPLPIFGQVDSFSLTAQNGRPVAASDLKGHVWMADFIFTRCAGTCTVMTQTMAALDKQIADLPDVKLVSFTMDPEHDTLEVLAAFAELQGAKAPRWLFLTGKKQEMYTLTRDQFKLMVTDQGGTSEEPIIHSDKLVLVDQKGRIRGYYSGQDAESVKVLSAAVRKLVNSRQE